MTTVNDYPLTKFHFSVNWGGADMSFQEVTGLELTRETAEYRGGMDPSFTKQCIPGMKSYGELTLKRGTFAGSNDFFDWWNGDTNKENNGMPERRTVTITLLNAARKAVVTWTIDNALPTKVTSTDLNAQNNEIAIETLVLKHEGIHIAQEA
ncbi:phage tail-like protein [Nitrosomonas nitrosa]|uniref:phage tail protein n=1 Tax=Nitrosomonas nitrosa TaxID=52442 RepID=UPI000D2F6310|nr:phage tail protein [Nitrosomonas nitrosa]PTQ91911.1 phage tail-like protein [Nitrosomonas nitrosa]